jgi:hypothetical protein
VMRYNSWRRERAFVKQFDAKDVNAIRGNG